MKRVTITDKYFIEIEDLNYTLKKRVPGKNKKGEPIETTRVVGYYGDMKAALESVMNQMVGDEINGDVPVAECLDVVKDVINRIMGALDDGSDSLSANTE